LNGLRRIESPPGSGAYSPKEIKASLPANILTCRATCIEYNGMRTASFHKIQKYPAKSNECKRNLIRKLTQVVENLLPIWRLLVEVKGVMSDSLERDLSEMIRPMIDRFKKLLNLFLLLNERNVTKINGSDSVKEPKRLDQRNTQKHGFSTCACPATKCTSSMTIWY